MSTRRSSAVATSPTGTSFSVISSDRGRDRSLSSSFQSIGSRELSSDYEEILVPQGSTILRANSSLASRIESVIQHSVHRQESSEEEEEISDHSLTESDEESDEEDEDARAEQRRIRDAEPGVDIARLTISAPEPSRAPAPIGSSKTQKRAAQRKRAALRKLREVTPTPTTTPPALASKFDKKTYDEAVSFITSYIDARRSSGSKPTTETRLHLLQSLIIEFGLDCELPTSCKAAKKVIKQDIHVNVREYLNKRGPKAGVREMQKLIHPSTKSLKKSLNKKTRMNREAVKEHGLEVFLVTL